MAAAQVVSRFRQAPRRVIFAAVIDLRHICLSSIRALSQYLQPVDAEADLQPDHDGGTGEQMKEDETRHL